MLNKITDTNIQNSQVNQSVSTDKSGLFAKSNPYEKNKNNLLIDELDISSDAITLYEKYKDIKNSSEKIKYLHIAY